MKLGDCFTMAVPPKYDVPHLFFAITEPSADGKFIGVNVTTDVIRAGRECLMNVGDHRWITRECFVTFGDAMLMDQNKINKLVGRLVQLEDSLSKDVLDRIIRAAKVSKAMPDNLKSIL